MILLSLVMLMLTSALHFGMRLWDKTENGDSFEIIATQDFLRRVLSEARPVTPDLKVKAKLQNILFAGGGRSIRFVAPMPGYLGLGGLYELAIYQQGKGHAGNQIDLSWRPFRRTGNSFASPIRWQRIRLLDKVSSVRFAYLGGDGQWHGSWQKARHLPKLIRMSVTLDTADRAWPSLVVSPHVNAMSLVIDPDDL
jgi:general secretion pathway protein J